MGRVQLYCPSTNKTVDGFVIGAFQKPEQVLQGVRLALDIKHAALYTIEAKPISDPHSLQEDQRVLVAASKDEKMLPDAPYGYVRYDGEEIGDIDPDMEGFGLDWQDLTDIEKRIHIAFLSTLKPTTRNKLRITRDYSAVHAELLSIQQSDLSTAKNDGSNSNGKSTKLSTARHEDLIQDRWGMQLDHFLRQVTIPTGTATTATTAPSSMKYPSYGTRSQSTGSSSSSSSSTVFITPSSLTPATIAALSVLASFSHGQARLAAEVLSEAVAMRLGGDDKGEDQEMGLREDDVGNAVEIVFERAGMVPVKLTAGKKTRKRAKGRAAARKVGGGSSGA